MFTIINIILFILAIKSYIHKKYVATIVAYSFFISNGFIINWGSSIIKPQDFGLLLLLICCVIGRKRDISFFSIKHSPFAFVVALFLLFFLTSFIYSYVLEVDSLKNILAVIRAYFSFAIYFVIRKVPYDKLIKSFMIIGKLVVLSSILFCMQYITHIPFLDTYIAETTEFYRMQVTPPFLQVLFLFLLFYGQNIKKRYLILILIFCVMILSKNRTPIYALCLQVIIFIVFSQNAKHKIPIILLSIFAVPVITSMMESRDDGDGDNFLSLKETWTYVKGGDYESLSRVSTFMFRIALCAERADYIASHPENLILGVGAMHEESKNNKFMFKVGTNYTASDGSTYKGQLQTGDTSWGPIIIRYGLLGIIVTLGMLIYSICIFFKNRKNKVAMFGYIYILGILVMSISSASAFTYVSLFIYSLLFAVFERNKNLLISSKFSLMSIK